MIIVKKKERLKKKRKKKKNKTTKHQFIVYYPKVVKFSHSEVFTCTLCYITCYFLVILYVISLLYYTFVCRSKASVFCIRNFLLQVFCSFPFYVDVYRSNNTYRYHLLCRAPWLVKHNKNTKKEKFLKKYKSYPNELGKSKFQKSQWIFFFIVSENEFPKHWNQIIL